MILLELVLRQTLDTSYGGYPRVVALNVAKGVQVTHSLVGLGASLHGDIGLLPGRRIPVEEPWDRIRKFNGALPQLARPQSKYKGKSHLRRFGI